MSINDFRYDGSRKLKMSELPTGADAETKAQKDELIKKTAENIEQACELQEKLYAERVEGLIIALQARDAAGKDSLIKKVFSGLNPAALEVSAFKAPTSTELAHDYLWRLNAVLPVRGKIGVFNRSHYEDVLAVKVHHLERGFKMAKRCMTGDFFECRYRQLRDWERYLYENSYRVVKVLLNVSAETQRERFLDRMELDEKHWKLSVADLKERALWKEYDEAYEDAVNHTATPESPWYVLPADNKWYTRYLMSEILLETLKDMKPEYPELSAEEAAALPHLIEELGKEKK